MLKVIDKHFNFLGQVDDYASFIAERSYFSIGELELRLAYRKERADILVEDNIVFKSPEKPYIITYREINSEDGLMLIQGEELKSYMTRWITKPPEGEAYHRINDYAETIMKSYVARNCQIPYLEIAADQARGSKFVFQTRYKQLDEELAKIGLTSGLGWTVKLDLVNKKYVFDVLVGVDRTAGQDVNSRAIFSDEFDNLSSQKIMQSKVDYKNVAFVAGQGEGASRRIITVGEASGFDRHEVFIDARDIENDEDLPDRGMQKLSEYEKISAFESQILEKSNLVYEEDYNLGDGVTIQNKEWGVTVDTRLENITEIYETGRVALEAVFGKTVPTFTELIKKKLDQPVSEGGGGGGSPNLDGGKPETEYGGLDAMIGGGVDGS